MNAIEDSTRTISSSASKPTPITIPQQTRMRSLSSSPTSMSLSTLPRLSQEGRIRLRLLRSLGIDPKQSHYTNNSSNSNTTIPPPKPAWNNDHNSLINYTKTLSAPFLQPLKDSKIGGPRPTSTFSSTFFSVFDASNDNSNNSNTRDTTSSSTNSNSNNNSNNGKDPKTIPKKRRVRFDKDVLVVPIPSRHAYSDRIKSTIWRNGNELKDIVDRNRYEYTVEGWDWMKVLEDEYMYVDMATGEKVHPCWVEDDTATATSGLGSGDLGIGDAENTLA